VEEKTVRQESPIAHKIEKGGEKKTNSTRGRQQRQKEYAQMYKNTTIKGIFHKKFPDCGVKR